MLPKYHHNMRVVATGAEMNQQLKRCLTALFQFMSVGQLVSVLDGPKLEECDDGNVRITMEFVLETTCPPHELDEGSVVITVTNAQRVGTSPDRR